MTDSYAVRFEKATLAVQERDSKAALVHLGKILTYPGILTTSTSWSESLTLIARAWAEVPDTAPTLIDLAQQVATDPENADTLYQLGTQLIEYGMPAYGATVLARAYRLNPDDPRILPEWVAALEITRHHGEAVRLLQAASPTKAGVFLYNYLLGFNALMTGDLETPRRLLPQLHQGAKDATERYMAWRLTGMIARVDAIAPVSALDDKDQRGWHFVLTAGILLAPVPASATVGWYDDSPASLLGGVHRLKAVLEVFNLHPASVIELPARNHAILAHTTAALLNVPLRPWSPDGNDYSNAVIPVYDLEGVFGSLHADLQAHHPRSVLWAHHANWTREQPFAADMTTLLHKSALSFWESRMVANPDTFELDVREADDRSVEAIAAEIIATPLPPDTLADLEALRAFATAAATLTGEHGPAALQPAEKRLRQWAGSPALKE